MSAIGEMVSKAQEFVTALASASNSFTLSFFGVATDNLDMYQDARVAIPGVTTDSGNTTATVCEDTTSHKLYFGSGTLTACHTTSTRAAKTRINDIGNELANVMLLRPDSYFYKKGFGDNGAKEQYGFMAEDFSRVFPTLTFRDRAGKPNGVDMGGLIPVLVKAIQEERAEIIALKHKVAALEHRRHQ